MATSSKVVFNLETLKEKALESINQRITNAQLEVDSYEDDAEFAERVAEWRARQEARLSEIFRQLDTIDNVSLANFRLEEAPEIDKWGKARAVSKVRELENLRTQIIAKSDSLVPDADGNISLTKTQLSEFFGL